MTPKRRIEIYYFGEGRLMWDHVTTRLYAINFALRLGWVLQYNRRVVGWWVLTHTRKVVGWCTI
jgi:hypothetical protein